MPIGLPPAAVGGGTPDDGSVSTAKIVDDAVTLAKVAEQAANTVLANATGSTANPTAFALGASTIFARLASGNIVAATPTQMRTLLALTIGTDVQAFDTDLAAIAALTSAADKLPYATGAGTWALADFTAAGRALMDDAAASNQRTTLGLGTAAVANTGDFDAAGAAAAAQAASQPLDADLTAIAGLTATTDNFLQAKASAWSSRTVAQVKTDLALYGRYSTTTGFALTSSITRIVGSVFTAIGLIPGVACHMKRICISGDCTAAVASPVASVVVWKNAILATSNVTDRALVVTQALAANTGFTATSTGGGDSGKDAFTASDQFSVGVWISSGTSATVSMSLMIEWQID